MLHLAENLRLCRLQKGMTQEELAECLGGNAPERFQVGERGDVSGHHAFAGLGKRI